MHYVVMDLEWNQAMSSKSSVFNKLPIHLRGEIIEIGAVKLNEDMTPGEEFQIDVKPMYFKRMHYKVKKLTGFDRERLAAGVSFPEALAQFRAWCGDDVTFLTWGCDDQGILEQNIIIHDLDWDWIAGWINLQLIYNLQTDGDRNQKSLATAMEHFAIEQTRIAHDALGDAYNTALVCTHLNMEKGLAGLSFAHGIPGTVGGAVVMNAGAYGGEIRDVLVSTRVYSKGKIYTVTGADNDLSYRHSRFTDSGEIVLEAVFRLEPGDPEKIREEIRDLAERRRKSQPLDQRSAGSTFKRPATGYAAAMIEQAGLKGLTVGGAQVSEKHAGFVINRGGATCEDVRELMRQVQQAVREKFGTELEPEVKLWSL